MENRYTLVIHASACKDLEKVFQYVSLTLSNPQAATSLINAFYDAFETLTVFPKRCPLINNEYVKDKSLRKLIVKNYIAFYRVDNREVHIIRVIYGMSNYQEIL